MTALLWTESHALSSSRVVLGSTAADEVVDDRAGDGEAGDDDEHDQRDEASLELSPSWARLRKRRRR